MQVAQWDKVGTTTTVCLQRERSWDGRSSRKSKYHCGLDWHWHHWHHLEIFTPAACSDLMQLLDQLLQVVHILAGWIDVAAQRAAGTRRGLADLGTLGVGTLSLAGPAWSLGVRLQIATMADWGGPWLAAKLLHRTTTRKAW